VTDQTLAGDFRDLEFNPQQWIIPQSPTAGKTPDASDCPVNHTGQLGAIFKSTAFRQTLLGFRSTEPRRISIELMGATEP